MNFRQGNSSKFDWNRYLEFRRPFFLAADLPPSVTMTEDRFVDFCMHGYIDHHDDPYGCNSDSFSAEQYEAFKLLVHRFFEDGHGGFSVIALSSDDYVALNNMYPWW